MRGIVLSESTAGRVWTILVEECGASEDDRGAFVSNAGTRGVTEWRFQGSLGFGGKFYANSVDEFRVSCYPEDETPARARKIASANARLYVEARK